VNDEPEIDEPEEILECRPAGRSTRPDRMRSALVHGDSRGSSLDLGLDLEELRSDIELARDTGRLDRGDAAVQLMYVTVIESPASESKDKVAALNAIARIRGLFAAKRKDEKKDLSKKPMAELLKEINQKTGQVTISPKPAAPTVMEARRAQ
jgi:hypothetical protein